MKNRELLLMLILMAAATPLFAQDESNQMLGEQGYLLPNGWTITPTGRQVDVPDLPTKVVVAPAGVHAFVLTSGWNDHGVSVIDLGHNQKTQTVKLKTSWLGMALNASDDRLYVSGGTRPVIEVMAYDAGQRAAPLQHLPAIQLDTARVSKPYLGGIAVGSKGGFLYVADAHGQSLIEVDLKSGKTGRITLMHIAR